MLRNHSQIKEYKSLPEAANNETDLCSLIDTEFKKGIVKIQKELRLNIKELRADINSNADYFRKELENIRRNQEKLENSFAEMQTELKALKGRVNNAEKRIGDLEDSIIEITQSGQQTENQMKKHESNCKRPIEYYKAGQSMHNRNSEGKEKERGLKIYWKKLWLKTFQI